MEQRSAVDSATDRTLSLLELLAAQGQPLSLSDIAEHLAVPKSSVHRVLKTLVARGYATQEGDGLYAAGVRCFELGSLWVRNLDLRGVAAPHLASLNESTMETVHLGVYEHGDVIYVDKVESPHQVVARTYVGRRCPATCVSTGRVLLAHSEHREIERVLAQPLPAYTEHSITDVGELRALLETVRRDGYAVNHGSFHPDVGGIAAPIRDYTGKVVATVGLCLPEHRFGPDRFDGLRTAVQDTATRVTTALGGPILTHPAAGTPART